MKKKKILIVEDENSLQNAMREFLLAENFNVVTADDGEMAVNLAKNEKPDLIMLDIILPKKDGFEVLAEVKVDERTRNIPIILLTNLEDAGDIERAFSLGINMYLVKSNYSLSDIVNKIKGVLKN
ncbi:MAG: two component response regulator [uncultured bacterium]|nr:MAG: two component response regulator [uncultured bacterium]HCU70623.1 response regulator [Candidatus Moranbacteria bacterium]